MTRTLLVQLAPFGRRIGLDQMRDLPEIFPLGDSMEAIRKVQGLDPYPSHQVSCKGSQTENCTVERLKIGLGRFMQPRRADPKPSNGCQTLTSPTSSTIHLNISR